jgi:hypothetical protein
VRTHWRTGTHDSRASTRPRRANVASTVDEPGYFHTPVLDGVFSAGQAGGGLTFHPAPAPTDARSLEPSDTAVPSGFWAASV